MRAPNGTLMAAFVALLAVLAAPPATAQDQGSPFGGFSHDSSAPIEITSDTLEVHQADQLAIFSGDVVAGQGTLRLTADRLEVSYVDKDQGSERASGAPDSGAQDSGAQDSGTGVIREMVAIGHVFIANGDETAAGQRARYDIENGIITMTGDVVLTQGGNVISGKKLTIDLDSGQARVGGRVKSIFMSQDSESK